MKRALFAVVVLAGCSRPPAPPPASPPAPALPAYRGDGEELIGRAWTGEGLAWLDPAPVGQVTLVRWWTDTCPLCERSAPAIVELAREFRIGVVAIYHPKPPRDVPEAQIRDAAKRIGMPGALAVDRDWRVLERAWPSSRRRFTSVSLVLDRDARIRYVHAGGEFHLSSDPEHADCARDFETLKRVIAALK